MHGLLDSYDLRCKRPHPFTFQLPPTHLDTHTNPHPPPQRFRDEGCPNCEEFLHLQGSPDQIDSCTSQVFEGLITLADPTRSWVAKWQRLDKYVRGVYATKVSGQLPDDVRTTIEEEYRITYIP